MAGEIRDLMNRLSQPPTREEWELRQRAEIVQRWRRIAADLDAMVQGGTLDKQMSLGEAISKLNTLGIEDVR